MYHYRGGGGLAHMILRSDPDSERLEQNRAGLAALVADSEGPLGKLANACATHDLADPKDFPDTREAAARGLREPVGRCPSIGSREHHGSFRDGTCEAGRTADALRAVLHRPTPTRSSLLGARRTSVCLPCRAGHPCLADCVVSRARSSNAARGVIDRALRQVFDESASDLGRPMRPTSSSRCDEEPYVAEQHRRFLRWHDGDLRLPQRAHRFPTRHAQTSAPRGPCLFDVRAR